MNEVDPCRSLNRLLRAGETKLVKRLARIAQHIDTLEPEVQELSDAALRAKTIEFALRHRGRWSAEVEKRLLAGEPIVVDELPDEGIDGVSYDPAESLDELLPEAFAVVREAAQRTIGQRPFTGAADGRRGAAPGQHRRDEDR